MKKFKFLSMLLIMLVSAFSFSACSDDDDNSVDSASIVGRWVTYDWFYIDADPVAVAAKTTFVFKSNRTGEIILEDPRGYATTETYTFEYSIATNEGEMYVSIINSDLSKVNNTRYEVIIGAKTMHFGSHVFTRA